MTTQPAQFMFAFSVCMVILAVAQVLYVLWDCLGVRPVLFVLQETHERERTRVSILGRVVL